MDIGMNLAFVINSIQVSCSHFLHNDTCFDCWGRVDYKGTHWLINLNQVSYLEFLNLNAHRGLPVCSKEENFGAKFLTPMPPPRVSGGPQSLLFILLHLFRCGHDKFSGCATDGFYFIMYYIYNKHLLCLEPKDN